MLLHPLFSLNMHIYFCGSIRGGRDDVVLYQKIVKKCQQYGTVLTEHVSHGNLTEKGTQRTALFHIGNITFSKCSIKLVEIELRFWP